MEFVEPYEVTVRFTLKDRSEKKVEEEVFYFDDSSKLEKFLVSVGEWRKKARHISE